LSAAEYKVDPPAKVALLDPSAELPTSPEKLTSDLPNGSDAEDTVIADNPIKVAWLGASREQRLEFTKDHGEAVADWLASSAGEKGPTKYRIWDLCTLIEASLDELDETFYLDYESLADQLAELRDRIDDELAEAEEDAAEEPAEVAAQ
jgi:hypothetical protein